MTSVGSGEEALGLLAAGQPLDLVLLDMNMPGLNGFETLVRLRQLRPGLPVLLATGYADEELRARLETMPGATLLKKPFSLKELEAALRSLAVGRPV